MKKLEQKKIWDPVTRLWHWVTALVVMTNWGLGQFMSFDNISWHFYLGYTLLGLIVFRVLWGFVGPQPVRWSSLWPRPAALLNYLRRMGSREPSGVAGHNPVGSLSVFAIILALAGQAGSGLFIESDDFFESAPLVSYVSESTVNSMTWWHHFLSDVLLALIILHLLAILFYRIWKREELVMPMITGWKWVSTEPSSTENESVSKK